MHLSVPASHLIATFTFDSAQNTEHTGGDSTAGAAGNNGNTNPSYRCDPQTKSFGQSAKKRSFANRDAGGADGVGPALRPHKKQRTACPFSLSLPPFLASVPAALSAFFLRLLPFRGITDTGEAEDDDVAAATDAETAAGIPREAEDEEMDVEIAAATDTNGARSSPACSLCNSRKSPSSTATTACSTPATLDAADDDDDFPALDDDWGGDVHGDIYGHGYNDIMQALGGGGSGDEEAATMSIAEPLKLDSSDGRTVLSILGGWMVYRKATVDPFFKPYFDQEGIALSQRGYIDIASRFTVPFLCRIVSADATPACCITMDEVESFFHKNSRRPGSYKSAIFVYYKDLVAFLKGEIEFPADFDERYKPDLLKLVKETIKIVDGHYDDDRSEFNPRVAMLYDGLTCFNVVYNANAEDDDEARKGRMQQHLARGSGQSLHSAGLALFIKSELFKDSQHRYGLTAPTEYGDVVTVAGCEMFESAAFVGEGRRWTSEDGETLNKACVGLVSTKKGHRDHQLWEQVAELRYLLGDGAPLPGYLADIARNSVLKRYIIQTLELSEDADPAAITLKQFSSAISAHASAVRWDIPMDDARAAALVAQIPRDELLAALDGKSPSALNSLIKKYDVVGCHALYYYYKELCSFKMSGVYPRVKKLVLEEFGEEVIQEFKAKRKRAELEAKIPDIPMDDARAAALVAQIPRDELLAALDGNFPSALNPLIKKYDVVGCGTFGHDGSVYARVKKLILGEEEIEEWRQQQREKERQEIERRQQQRAKERQEREEREREVKEQIKTDPALVVGTAMNLPGWRVVVNRAQGGLWYISPDQDTYNELKVARKIHEEKFCGTK